MHADVQRFRYVVALAALPWTVLNYPGGVRLVFAWGLVNPNGPHVVTVVEYLTVHVGSPAGLPGWLLAWPVSTCLYAGALASAGASALAGREDRRLTGGLLALAGVVHLRVALGVQTGVAVPIGPACALLVAWWCYWPAVAGE